MDKKKEKEFKAFVEEVIEDTLLFGFGKICYVYLVSGNLISDYSLEREKIGYLDENVLEMSLFELLFNLIDIDYVAHGVRLPRKAILVKTIRQCSSLSQVDFSVKANVPTRTLENWERGVREPSLDVLLKIAKCVNIDNKLVLKIVLDV